MQHVLYNPLFEIKNEQKRFDSLKEDHEQLLKAIETSSLIDFSNFYLVRNISYVKINDYDQIWLKSSLDGKNKEGTVFGLIQDGYAAGIARFEDNHLIGYLNGDDNCSYSVMIGENKIPGVAKYDINRGFIVDYIPLFPAVEVGDVVYTSGYDKIFYTGIPVGGVQAVEYRQGYQIAVVKPVSQKISRFYWLVDVNPKENIEVNLD
ncbi:MAG: rod shape-determining protein MreC, partial [Helicobacter sp.]|nr:rod shape-determining protein MreC [Helicobacter sp.]